ncbi:MAG TPA: transposase, partial [Candidatus Ornithospirochaeta stercorigallinarum]|nr:transposase [Candidatus Ornithospirochaeta stercorigallinarum]
KMMVLIIYAYMNGTFSSREIEKLMRRDCVCMRVLGMDGIPDHSFFFLFALTLLMFYNFQKQREFFYGKGIYRGDRSGHH